MNTLCQLKALYGSFSRHDMPQYQTWQRTLTLRKCQLCRELLPYTWVTTQEGEGRKTEVNTKGMITLWLNTANVNKTNVSLAVICHKETQSMMLDSVWVLCPLKGTWRWDCIDLYSHSISVDSNWKGRTNGVYWPPKASRCEKQLHSKQEHLKHYLNV